EPGRGMLHSGSISDASGADDVYVQHNDVSLNRGWSFRFHPVETTGTQLVSMARGANGQIHLGANTSLPPGQPTSDGMILTVAPRAAPTVQVFAAGRLA